MSYVVNVDHPTNSALAHKADCYYHKRYRGEKSVRDGAWHGPFDTCEEALAFARSTGKRDARLAIGCCGL